MIILRGKNVTPLVSFNYSITDNRFIKEVSVGGTSVVISGVDGILIQNNTFTVSDDIANRAESPLAFGGFRSNNLVVNQNIAYRQSVFISGVNTLNARIDFNKVTECNRFANASNNQNDPSIIDITDNIITDPKGLAPTITYARNSGVNLSSPNIARIDRNIVTVNATGTAGVPQALIQSILDNPTQNCQVFIRDNKLKFTGNFNLQSDPLAFTAGVRLLNNNKQATITGNEVEFEGTNFNGVNKVGIAVYHFGLTAGTTYDIMNNKVVGYNSSVVIQQNDPTSSTSLGPLGQLPEGVFVNINNNSFTGDVMSINNGTSSQEVQANCNWYGSSAVQDFINKISLGTVNFVPWLINGTDNDPATGFQPVAGACDNGYPTLITLEEYTNVTCNGAEDGSISINVSYGNTPFVFTWTKEGDPGFVSHEEDPTGLAPGNYHLSIVDGNGSNIYITDPEAEGPTTIDVTITEPPLLTAGATGTNVDCFGNSNGTAIVNADGGNGPYTYLWSNGETTASINNLVAGNYSVNVTDVNGCSAQANYEVTEPSLLTADATGVNINCFGGSEGSASVTAEGGTGTYYYMWSNGAETASINNLVAGIYNVTVTDANGCSVQASYEVTQPALLTAEANGSNISCFDGSDGSVSVTAGGGTGTYSYLWSNGATTTSISNIVAGNYSVTVTDANGCTAQDNYEVTQPALLTAAANGSNVSCFGGSNGSASVIAGGGTGTYSYLWNTGAITSSINNLATGIFNVTVTDANGCTASAAYTVTQPAAPLTVNLTGTKASCVGSVTATASGGTIPYSYSWNNGATTQTINGVPNGTYIVTVTDANGCIITGTYTVTGSSPINPTTSQINISCFGESTGSITVTGAGGTPPHTYSINGSPYQSNNVFSNLIAGTYQIGVKDAAGCFDFVSRTITQPPLLAVTLDSVHNACFATNNGRIYITVSGGSGTRTYNWTGPNGFTSTVQDPNNLFGGVYNVTVTDTKGCSVVLPVDVIERPLTSISETVTNVGCKGSFTGSIDATIIGGSGTGFTYKWTGPNGFLAITEDISSLKAGNYTLTATDNENGCAVTKVIVVTQPATVLSLTLTKTNVTGCNSLGTITGTGAGGTSPYQYSLNGVNYQSSNLFTGLYGGTDTLWVKDVMGCTAFKVTTINDGGTDEYEANNGQNKAAAIAINAANIFARIGPLATDVDWFKFTTGNVAGTHTVTVTHPSVNYTFNLYNSAGTLIAPTSAGTVSKTYASLAVNTTYSIKINGPQSYICYNISVTNNFSSARSIAPVSSVTNGNISINNRRPPVTVEVLKANAYPNPHQGIFDLQIISPENGWAGIELFNANGQKIISRRVAMKKGINIVTFSNIKQSLVFYRISIGRNSVTGKVIGPN
jgi:hypothetical protein